MKEIVTISKSDLTTHSFDVRIDLGFSPKKVCVKSLASYTNILTNIPNIPVALVLDDDFRKQSLCLFNFKPHYYVLTTYGAPNVDNLNIYHSIANVDSGYDVPLIGWRNGTHKISIYESNGGPTDAIVSGGGNNVEIILVLEFSD